MTAGQYDVDSTVEEARPRGGRLPRRERRAQLLDSALEVFVAQGYHAAAMDDIADRAGVSKPVLYQHFPGKLDLYLALLDASCDQIIANTRVALESTKDNQKRVEATMAVFYDYVASDSGAFKLVFESDLTNEPAVREHVERVTSETAALVAQVIHEDTGLPDEAARLLAVSLVGMAQVSATVLAHGGRRHQPRRRSRPGGRLGVARDRGLPAVRRPRPAPALRQQPRRSTSVEVKIGIQHAPRELVVDTDETADAVEKMVADAVGSEGVLALTDSKGRKIIVPAARIAYVEIGGALAGQVGFRS